MVNIEEDDMGYPSGDKAEIERLRLVVLGLEDALGRLRPLRESSTAIQAEIERIRGCLNAIECELRGALVDLGTRMWREVD
jgi:hypothetical protein